MFPNDAREGWQPKGLIPDHAGGFYGAPLGGGAVRSAGVGGTLFHLTPPGPGRPQWTKTILHSFGAGADGEAPIGALIQDEKGVIFGATQHGGGASAGAVFMMTTP